MKKQLSLLMAVLMLPLIIMSNAHAESVTVNIDATVIQVDDPYGVVPEIALGDSMGGSYTYETLTPDLEPLLEKGVYPHEGGSGSLNLALGPYQVQTDTAQTGAFGIDIDDEYTPGWEWYMVMSHHLLPNNGVIFEYAGIDLGGNNGGALPSAALTTTPPNPLLFNINRNVYIQGTKDGFFFSVILDVTGLAVASQTEPQQTRYEYRANAVVTYLDDPGGVLAGRVDIDSMINAGFIYDLATPNSSSYPSEGLYLHAPGTGGVSVSFADVVLSTDPEAQTPEVHVFNSDDPAGWDHFGIIGNTVVSNNTAITAYNVGVLFDGSGAVFDSIEMPAGNLSLPDWNDTRIMVIGNGWSFEARITSLELVKVPVVEVFPADGGVHPMQHFDMALRVVDQALITGINGTNNGQDISPYLVGCAILPKQDLAQSVVCPDTTSILVPGGNSLQLQVMLDDGRVHDANLSWVVRE